MGLVCNNGVREFPTALTCVTKENYKVTADYKKAYGFGGKSVVTVDRVYIDIEVLLDNNVDLSLFTYWFYNEIDRGELDFTIDLIIFGTQKMWTVRIAHGTNYTTDGYGKIQLKLELVDTFVATEEQLCKFTEGL